MGGLLLAISGQALGESLYRKTTPLPPLQNDSIPIRRVIVPNFRMDSSSPSGEAHVRRVMITVPLANIRKAGRVSAPKLGRALQGETAELMDSQNGWSLLSFSDRQISGWVRNDLLTNMDISAESGNGA
jgi:hypothetical protein